MTTEAIIESEMVFGPYLPGHCFYIEKSRYYQRLQEGVQMAEFLLLKSDLVIWVVEAKKSSPRPETQPNFNEFINEVCAKLTNGFLLGLAACLQRHPEANTELPDSFKTLAVDQLGFRFILVINGHKEEWLAPIQSALYQALKPLVKVWKLPATSVVVLNHELAKEHGLILNSN